MAEVRILVGDVRDKLAELPDESVHCVVTSPPYFGLRDYGVAGQIGLEATPAEFVAVMVDVFREVRRVLRKDGTCWINLGDSFADKQLQGIPWRVAFALQADGWYLRQDIIWSKPNPMPESVTDRCTKAHEYLFLLSKNARYHYDAEAIAKAVTESTVERLSQPTLAQQHGSDRVPGKTNGNMKAVGSDGTRNRRSVWTVATQPFKEAHFATFPPDLIEPCIKAGCPKDCCAKCGAPVVREIETTYGKSPAHGDGSTAAGKRGGGEMVASDGLASWSEGKPRVRRIDTTTGWSPSCSCDAGLARGTVLDPFGGAGTTGLVADRLQRDAILIELNPEYAAMARERIHGDAPLFSGVDLLAAE